LTLKLFGTPAVESDGELVASRAAQGHRLALLAMLALARGRPVARDRITALLWPESPTDRVRHQLSDAVYIVRSALGADVVRSTGDDLGLNADVVTSDVGTFEQLLDDGALERAVESFTAPLLDGFHLPDGGEFERWLDGERARLAQRYTGALESLAEESETQGDYAAAEKWSRRLAAHDPYSGRVALRLMRALDAAGDRAGALRHARIHEALLREEFEAEPDPAVTAFAERLRVDPRERAVPERATAPVQPTKDREPSPETPASVASIPASDAPGAPPPSRTWRALSYAAAATVILLVLALVWNRNVSRAPNVTAPAARSLAVLPFVNMSSDPANVYFSDGLSEEIITALSRIDGLRVAARTSSFALRDDKLDVRVIGDTLGVEAVLEGSIRKEGNRLRVTAQLIDTETGYHIWTRDYDREVADVIAVQDEIAREIAAALELRLPPRATATRAQRTPNLEAYDLYLRALYLRSRLSPDALRQATDLLDRAIELSPDFALAYATKTSVIAPRIYFRYLPRDEGVREMRAAVARALELDPNLGEAYVGLGILKLFYEWDWPSAEQALRQAVRLSANDAHAWHNLANYLDVVGRLEEAVDARLRGVALDPLDARLRMILGVEYTLMGKLDDALLQYEHALRLDPSNALVLGLGPALPGGPVRIFLARRQDAEAVQELIRVAALRGATAAELEAMRGAFAKAGIRGVWRVWIDMDMRQHGGAIDPLRAAVLWASAGDTEQALDWLERAHAERNPGLIFLRSERAFVGLQSNPRFVRIVKEMKLASVQGDR
jgi:TolB-like protein/DNA-binding SARP family transcriptional activator/cytochrome c-type biogenesis protein CcmH/NrfG